LTELREKADRNGKSRLSFVKYDSSNGLVLYDSQNSLYFNLNYHSDNKLTCDTLFNGEMKDLLYIEIKIFKVNKINNMKR
jgi:hypothetical protein